MNNNLVELSAEALAQGEDILHLISDHQFVNTKGIFTASIGQHLRHVAEHYELLLCGVESGTVNYDLRERGGSIEYLRLMMVRRFCSLRRRLLTAFSETDSSASIMVHNNESEIPIKSSLGRELMFVHSHAVHHYAMISAQLLTMGCEINENFGVAPSTLRYRENSAALSG